jgi:SAM-dependent methyltransferase
VARAPAQGTRGPADQRTVSSGASLYSAYTAEFFRFNRETTARSANVIAPIVLAALSPFRPRSIVDVGCGAGGWAATFLDLGITDVLGIDRAYVGPAMMLIPESNFLACDVAQPVRLGRRFDLALSLEVGEHIPPDASETLVASLTVLSDLVLFSAAIPGQGGTNHINEQWPEYWVCRFRAHGYAVADLFRPMLWENTVVDWWYAQNLLLFVRASALDAYPSLAGKTGGRVLPLVHPRNYAAKLERLRVLRQKVAQLDVDPREMGIRRMLSLAPAVVAHTVTRRIEAIRQARTSRRGSTASRSPSPSR